MDSLQLSPAAGAAPGLGLRSKELSSLVSSLMLWSQHAERNSESECHPARLLATGKATLSRGGPVNRREGSAHVFGVPGCFRKVFAGRAPWESRLFTIHTEMFARWCHCDSGQKHWVPSAPSTDSRSEDSRKSPSTPSETPRGPG